jgi:inhibitor of KinA sporulation pathway (predicted exonuclease)
MKVAVVDLELTQNEGSQPQIIQIGAVCGDIHGHVLLNVFDMICNPGELPNSYITQLTGITPEQVQQGVPLAEALRDFWVWVENNQSTKLIIEWGGGDIAALIEASHRLNVQVPRIFNLNLKLIAQIMRAHKGTKRKGGLGNTLELYDLSFIGTPHNALHDAFNTFLLACKFESMWKFASDVEFSHGSTKIKDVEKLIDNFKSIIGE